MSCLSCLSMGMRIVVPGVFPGEEKAREPLEKPKHLIRPPQCCRVLRVLPAFPGRAWRAPSWWGGSHLQMGSSADITRSRTWCEDSGGIVYWGVGLMGSRDSQGEAAELGFLHNSRRAWPQPCLTDALRVACRDQRKTGLVNTLVSLWHSYYWQVGVMPRYPQAEAFPSVQQNPAEKEEGVRPVGNAWAALAFLTW